jgi:hypothetical protein
MHTELSEKSRRKEIVWTTRHRQENSRPIDPDLMEVECEDTAWMYMTDDWDQRRDLINTIVKLCLPQKMRYS